MFARFTGLVLLTIALAGCGGSTAQAPAPIAVPIEAQRAATPQAFTSEAGNYRIQFPGTPEIDRQTQNSPAGPLTLNIATMNDADHVNYTVTFTDFPQGPQPKGSVDPMLDNSVRAMEQAGNWKVVETGPTMLSGTHPGRDVAFEARSVQSSEPGRGRARIYVVGPRLYQVIAVGAQSKVNDQRLLAFLDSFALIKDVPALVEGGASADASKGSGPAAKPQPAAGPLRNTGRQDPMRRIPSRSKLGGRR